jgi:hypothetical protein
MENFNELLEAIASDLGIPRESIVSDGEWNGETIKKESIDENLYVSLFGSPYLIVEKGFTVVPVPEKKALRVPTEVEKVYYKTILIRDRNLHDEIIRRKARSEFQKQISLMDYAEAEALMDKQISLLSKILKNSTEEVQYRKNLLARKMLIDAYIKRRNGKV